MIKLKKRIKIIILVKVITNYYYSHKTAIEGKPRRSNCANSLTNG